MLETVFDLPLNLKERALRMLNLSNMTYFQNWHKCHTPLYSTIECKLAIVNIDTTCIIIHGTRIETSCVDFWNRKGQKDAALLDYFYYYLYIILIKYCKSTIKQ